MVAKYWVEKLNTLVGVICPKPSLTGCFSGMIHVPCCAATYDFDRVTGQHLRNNNNTLVDHIRKTGQLQQQKGPMHRKRRKQEKRQSNSGPHTRKEDDCEARKKRIREISKKIKNCIRDNKSRTRQKNQKILEEVKGTRRISSI